MHVHLVAVEVRVVALAVCVVHSQSGLLREHLHSVGHEASFVQSWLSIEKHIITSLQVPVDDLILMIIPKVSSMRYPLLFRQQV